MLILAIDTTGATLSAALLEDQTIRAEVFVNTGDNHSLHLLPAIRHIYDLAGLSMVMTDLFVCTLGPGSFTGVRIGVSTIKGLAMATGKPVVGFSTLEALAANVGPVSGSICPILDAQRGQVYTAIYKLDRNSIPQLIHEERLTGLELLLSHVKGKVLFIGSGAVKYADLINRTLPESIIAPVQFSHVRASVVGLLGLRKFHEGHTLDVLTFTPRYLRLSEAERKLEVAENSGNRVAGGFSPPAPTPPGMRVRTGRFTEITGP
jgi:tRNA threonylcarbamoyladenosine biosynthesis protein TsaB